MKNNPPFTSENNNRFYVKFHWLCTRKHGIKTDSFDWFGTTNGKHCAGIWLDSSRTNLICCSVELFDFACALYIVSIRGHIHWPKNKSENSRCFPFQKTEHKRENEKKILPFIKFRCLLQFPSILFAFKQFKYLIWSEEIKRPEEWREANNNKSRALQSRRWAKQKNWIRFSLTCLLNFHRV